MEIECITATLLQWVSNDVGMEVSFKNMSAMFNANNQKIIDNNVVCLWKDRCLQIGVSNEVGKITGHWELDILIVILDANDATLDYDLSK